MDRVKLKTLLIITGATGVYGIMVSCIFGL